MSEYGTQIKRRPCPFPRTELTEWFVYTYIYIYTHTHTHIYKSRSVYCAVRAESLNIIQVNFVFKDFIYRL